MGDLRIGQLLLLLRGCRAGQQAQCGSGRG
jgi:hypothetical protein